jgi:hypothetical protein
MPLQNFMIIDSLAAEDEAHQSPLVHLGDEFGPERQGVLPGTVQVSSCARPGKNNASLSTWPSARSRDIVSKL